MSLFHAMVLVAAAILWVSNRKGKTIGKKATAWYGVALGVLTCWYGVILPALSKVGILVDKITVSLW